MMLKRRSLCERFMFVLVYSSTVLYFIRVSTASQKHEHSGHQAKDYKGHSLMRVTPNNDHHLKLLNSLHEKDLHGVEFWREPSRVRRSVDILVSRDMKQNLSSSLQDQGLRVDITHNDIQVYLDEQLASVDAEMKAAQNDQPSNFNFTIYHDYDSIMDWLNYIASNCGKKCQLIEIGKSYEERDLKVLKIGVGKSKPALWLDAGIHAREWVSPASALFIINKLLDPASKEGKYLTNRFNWYILPMVNPDGYSYSWTTDRLWRKSRSHHPDSAVQCRGVDLNRNWDFQWRKVGASKRPCSESYAGLEAFSEIEAKLMSDFILSIKDQLQGYISLHSYGQYILTPWGYTRELPDDYQQILKVADVGAAAIKKVSGSVYTTGSSAVTLYAASGCSDDWAKGVAGIKYSFTMELRDRGTYGFILPASQIEPTAVETFAGIRAMAGQILKSWRRKYKKHKKMKARS